MRPATVHSVLWAAAFTVALIVGVATFAYVQIDEAAMRTLTFGEIRQRLTAASAPVPVPPAAPADPVLPPAGDTPPSPRPIGGADDSAQKKTPGKEKSPSPSPSSSSSQPRTFNSTGGSVTATCRGTDASLVSWRAAFDFFTENVVRGPAPTAGVRFDKLDFGVPDVVVLVKCENGAPTATESSVRDGDTTGGGDDDDDGSGGGFGDDRGSGRGDGRGRF